MAKKMKKRFAGCFLLAVVLAGCGSINRELISATEQDAGPIPAEYRIIVRDYLRRTLFDPYTVRDAQISKPKLGRLMVEGTLGVHEPGWLVCFRGNGKNRMGGYTGLRDTALVIRDGSVRASLSDPDRSHYVVKMICAEERYDAFSELEHAQAQPRTR